MTELQKFSPSSLKHTPKKSAITIPPRVIELMEKVSLAAACLSREFQEMTMASEGERQANMLLTIDNFLSEIDTLFLCKIEDISETIPKELFQKIQDLRNFTEQAFIYFIEKGQLEFIGSGTEGAAHRLKVATKEGVEREFIVLKKSHSLQGDRLKNEFEIQEQAHIIASRMHGVEVPRPYMNFSRGEEHYLVMEYIPGKTLYTLQLEQVANKIVLERIFRTIANDTGISEGTKIQVLELLKEFYTSSQDETKITAPLTTPLYGFFERHNQENPIRFENDTVAEEKLMQLLQIAYQINAIDGDPMKKVLDPQF
jgi:hypothetical protein